MDHRPHGQWGAPDVEEEYADPTELLKNHLTTGPQQEDTYFIPDNSTGAQPRGFPGLPGGGAATSYDHDDADTGVEINGEAPSHLAAASDTVEVYGEALANTVIGGIASNK